MPKVLSLPSRSLPPVGSIPIAGRIYPGAGQLLTARIEQWARACQPWRVEQGFLLCDLADAFKVTERRLLTALEASGWWMLQGDFDHPLFFPPWVEQRGRATGWAWRHEI